MWGQGGSHLTTHPRAHKVTCIVSPSPEAVDVAPPVTGPSQMIAPALFEGLSISGGEEVRPSRLVLLGKCHSPSEWGTD